MIVGSAGSLQPLRRIVGALTPDLDAAFVIVTHRSVATHSYLTQILSRASTAPVVNAIDGTILRPGWVYVTPPGDRHISIDGRIIRFVAGPKVHLHRPAGDPLFESAARSFGKRAIGIVLSGMGRNGEAGLAAITRAGGKAFVQLPAEAEWPSMPEHALEVVEPDLCASGAEIASRVVALCRPIKKREAVDLVGDLSASAQSLRREPAGAQE